MLSSVEICYTGKHTRCTNRIYKDSTTALNISFNGLLKSKPDSFQVHEI